MTSAKKAKARLLGDRQSRTIDAKLAKVLPGYEAEESFEAKAAEREYGKNRLTMVMRSTDEVEPDYKELWKQATAAEHRLAGVAVGLRGEVNSLKEQRDRAQKEAKNLAKKLAAITEEGE